MDSEPIGLKRRNTLTSEPMAGRPTSSFHGIFDEQASQTPSAVASISSGSCKRRAQTYSDVASRSKMLAGALQAALSRCPQNDAAHRTIAIELSRVHDDFLPLIVASSRCGVPFVLLSTDLPDHALQNARAAFVLQSLKPTLWVVDASVCVSQGRISVQELCDGASTGSDFTEASISSCSILALMFTGGTSRTKVVQVTHDMVLHEKARYGDLWKPSSPVVVLAHTSVYWAASALGQLSLALAFQGCVVWTEATEASSLRRVIAEETVTVLGVVPDHLDLLAPEDPKHELPNIEAVFTWGERLPVRVAERWRRHQAELRELLIATEYWLAFWADPLGDRALQVLKGTSVSILTEEGKEALPGEVGELCIAGPMVMHGYLQLAGSEDCFHFGSNGKRYFKTRDLVRRLPAGFEYKGRADMMAKDKGKWVDMFALEERLSLKLGVKEAKLVPDPTSEHFHAFVVLAADQMLHLTLDGIRAELPARVQLWPVTGLPRHTVTRKVDTKRLLQMLGSPSCSWPVEGVSLGQKGDATTRDRLLVKTIRLIIWGLVTFGLSWILSESERLLLQLTMFAVCLLTISFTKDCTTELVRWSRSLCCVAIWLLMVAYMGPWHLPRLLRGTQSLLLVAYSWLALIYADDGRMGVLENQSRFARILMTLVDRLPLWKCGLLLLLLLLRHANNPLGVICHAMLTSGACTGAYLAAIRGRFLAWPLIFFTLGAGHQLERDCGSWLSFGSWCFWARSVADQLRPRWPHREQCIISSESNGKVTSCHVGDEHPSAPDCALQAKLCTICNEDVTHIRWPAQDEKQRPLCNSCGIALVEKMELQAATYLQSVMDCAMDFPVSPPQTTSPPSNLRKNKARDMSAEERKQQAENWWWHYRHTDELQFDALTHATIEKEWGQIFNAATSNVVAAGGHSTESRLVFTALEQVEPLLKPVTPETILLGLDSLRLARLINLIKMRLHRSLTVLQLREAKTAEQLCQLVMETPEVDNDPPKGADGAGEVIAQKEFAVWFSPGQYTPMGSWVLRTEDPLVRTALLTATQRLVDRHAALRVRIADPIRYLSIMYDVATLFTFYAPLLESGPAPLRWLRRLISWALVRTWPRIRVDSREEVYLEKHPTSLAPLEIHSITDGQVQFENWLKHCNQNMTPPGAVNAYELQCHLCDAWTFQFFGFIFVIQPWPASVRDKVLKEARSKLVYVDQSSGEWGPLVPPGSPLWQPPPHGFPALFFVPLSSGNILWIRLERRDELRILYRNAGAIQAHRGVYHSKAFRTAPNRGREAHEPTVVSFLGVGINHAFGDGGCYLPLVHDLLALYQQARDAEGSQDGSLAELPSSCATMLPAIGTPFAELEKRLFDTFHCRQTPLRASLRGSLWDFKGTGFGHNIGITGLAFDALTHASVRCRVPLDLVILGLVVCAQARVEEVDIIEFTLYAPMRDGIQDSSSVGLFADWRDVSVACDKDMATVLGTVLQLSHKIQHRQWSVFNALRKPERCIVNIQPFDSQQVSGFVNLPESMWWGGDQLGRPARTRGDLEWMRKPVGYTLVQSEDGSWWVLVGAAANLRPPAWMRRFVRAFEEAARAFLLDPMTLVHAPLRDEDLLEELADTMENGREASHW